MPVDYVMVPVPEELAPKVLEYVSWRGHPIIQRQRQDEGGGASTPDGAPTGDAEAEAETGGDPLATVFARLDAQSRTMLVVAAGAASTGERPTVADTARRAAMTEREVIGVITEVNNLVAGAGGPPVTVLVAGAEGAEDAPFSWERRIVLMGEPVATAINDLASARAD
jgi:hypothetical protein